MQTKHIYSILALFYLFNCYVSIQSEIEFVPLQNTSRNKILRKKVFAKDDEPDDQCDAECELINNYDAWWQPDRDWDLDNPWTQNADWMGSHKDLLLNTRIRDLIIPGTHDTGTYSVQQGDMSEQMYLAYKNQMLNIYTQLQYGVRFIDARSGCFNENMSENRKKLFGSPNVNDDDVYMYHSWVKAEQKWQSFMEDIQSFLTQYPDEIIILKCQSELKSDNRCYDNQKQHLFNVIEQTFGDSLVTMDDVNSWFNVQSVTVGDMYDHNKRVI